MSNYKHFFLNYKPESLKYKYTRQARGSHFKSPPRHNRITHGNSLINKFNSLINTHQGSQTIYKKKLPFKGIVVDIFSEKDFDLSYPSLERIRDGFKLLNLQVSEDDIVCATVKIKEGFESKFTKILEDYLDQDKKNRGKRRNQKLVDSINNIKLATIESFWTDTVKKPGENDKHWFEIWLNTAEDKELVINSFREVISSTINNKSDIILSQREIHFPERTIVLAFTSLHQLSKVENIFSYLAEIRLAQPIPTDYTKLSSKEQKEFVQEILTRITKPNKNSPSVCLLDTGISKHHKLLEVALNDEDTHSCFPKFDGSDKRGHGTEMAGLGLYGCLINLIESNERINLTHQIESVKILPDKGANPTDLWGDITREAVGRVEIKAPNRQRTFCLAITGIEKDYNGYPSSWSATIDQISSGQNDKTRRLFCISAGNVRSLEDKKDYPKSNHVLGIENPAQSWNALTIGAYTNKIFIQSEDFDGYMPLAKKGGLSPCSRTSLTWENNSCPLKPDIVFEGGNDAIEPKTKSVDFCDDLLLLTTKATTLGGSLLTLTGETSAATAQAARMAAIIQSNHKNIWPETVRALMINSASWSEEMINEFPKTSKNYKKNRIRCYGFGVPNLSKAISSSKNSVTLISQEHFSPFVKEGSNIKADEIHFHDLPWPKEVLESLDDNIEVTMKITLSYFIEPSPGRRGWDNKFRYQSHGLRFDVLRPSETIKQFKDRLTKILWEDENAPDNPSDIQNWELGPKLRNRGSVHSDIWKGSPITLASSGSIAIFPVTGWWKERKHLEGWKKKTRYSLVVTIETQEENIDLYSNVKLLVQNQTKINTTISV